MSETAKRVFVACGIVGVILIAVLLKYLGFNGVYWLSLLIAAGMIFEFGRCLWLAPRDVMFDKKNLLYFSLFAILLVCDFLAITNTALRPTSLLVIFITVCTADIGAWFFGKLIGGDKLWEKISEHKTWSGQIFGIICGTVAFTICSYLIRGQISSSSVLGGIALSLLSQYGDLTASFIKRKLKIKDFSNLLSVHGGLLDRFDGWIYILPLMFLFF